MHKEKATCYFEQILEAAHYQTEVYGHSDIG